MYVNSKYNTKQSIKFNLHHLSKFIEKAPVLGAFLFQFSLRGNSKLRQTTQNSTMYIRESQTGGN